MKKLLIILAGSLTLAGLAPAQTSVLYQQDFGTINGGNTLAAVGWSQILPPGGYSGMYGQPGAIDGTTLQSLPTSTLYFGGSAGNGIFYTVDGAGSGTGGDSSFLAINPTLYTNLNLSIEAQWSYQGANLQCWFAVQVGGNWYVSTNNPIVTAQQSAGATFYRGSMTYNPNATNWNILTNTTVADIGPQAPGNLSGNITGIGIMTTLIGSGSWNYNNFLITSISNTVVEPPTLVAAPISQQNYASGGVSFAVNANGSAPLKYIWKKDGVVLNNGSNISGATNSIITIQNISAADVGNYSVIVSNSAGFFDSSTNTTASLTVDTLPADYLYSESFPFVGAAPVSYPLSVVGWAGSVANATRLFQSSGGSGAIFNYEGGVSTTAYYTTTNTDNGASGLKFPKITPSSYPAVSFVVDIAPAYQPANVAAYFAVQMSGGNWYVNSTPIPVNTGVATGTYATYAQQFSPLAANWNNLTLNPTSATVGSAASGNLTGDIIGAGIVNVVASGGGNFNIDNFLVTTNTTGATAPTIALSPISQTVYSGAGVSFGGTAAGSQPLTYFWQKDGNPLVNGGNIFGANSNTITILNVNSNSAGQYSLIVSNSAGTDSSANYITTILTVNDRPTNLLYHESFPFVGPVAGNYPLSVVGWGIAVPDAVTRLYQNGGGDGAFYDFQGAAMTTAYYATTASDSGSSGLPFPSLGIAGAVGLTFSADIAPTYLGANITASIAVQINGTTWYVSTTNLPVDTSVDTTTYTTVSQAFSAAAANWKNLTITGTGATIGSTAGANLTGNITGAGLVFNHTGAGNFNVNTFQITGTVLTSTGPVAVGSMTSSTITLNWTASPTVHLQSATNLTQSVWTDVAGSTGQSSATVSKTAAQMFFRLINQ